MMSFNTNFKFCYTLKVRWSEVDAQKVVFNGNYLNYFDVAIAAYFEAVGLYYPASFLASEIDFFVRKATVTYHNSAHYNDELNIYVSVVRLGNSSVEFSLEITRQEVHIASGNIIYVNADIQTKKSAPLPAHIRAIFENFEGQSLSKTGN